MHSVIAPTKALILSDRDIPLKDLLFAKKIIDNYDLIITKASPAELLAEMQHAIRQIHYFTTTQSPCEARNALSREISSIQQSVSYIEFKQAITPALSLLNAFIDDRAKLISQEHNLLLAAGYVFTQQTQESEVE